MINAIYKRRSIRKFQDKPISEEDIIDILQCGIKAPSSKNRQPWKYIVVQGKAMVQNILLKSWSGHRLLFLQLIH